MAVSRDLSKALPVRLAPTSGGTLLSTTSYSVLVRNASAVAPDYAVRDRRRCLRLGLARCSHKVQSPLLALTARGEWLCAVGLSKVLRTALGRLARAGRSRAR